MEYILSYVMIVVEYFSLCLLADSLFPVKLRSRFARGAVVMVISAASLFLLMVAFHTLATVSKTLVAMLWLFLLLRIIYRASWKSLVLLEILFYGFLYIVDNSIMSLSMSLLHYSYPALVSDKASYLCGAFVSKLIELTICLLFGRVRKAKKSQSGHLPLTSWFYLLLTPIFSLVINLSIVTHAIASNDVGTWVILTTIGLLLCNVAVVFLWNQLEQEQQTLLENELLWQRIENNMERVTSLSQAYRRQRQQTHDFQSHMQAIESLISAGESDRALAYVQNWTKHSCESSQDIIHTNNPLVDTLLNQKYQWAREQNISVNLLVDDLEQLPVKDADFVTILSNLIDNAIEAAAQCERKKAVHIKLQRAAYGDFILSVRNTSKPVEIIDQSIRTTKSDPLAHGFGLENVKQMIAQNGGEYSLSQNDGWVQFTAIFPRNMQVTA